MRNYDTSYNINNAMSSQEYNNISEKLHIKIIFLIIKQGELKMLTTFSP